LQKETNFPAGIYPAIGGVASRFGFSDRSWGTNRGKTSVCARNGNQMPRNSEAQQQMLACIPE